MFLSFELKMPNVGSWNGRWTGEREKYYKHVKVTKTEGEKLLQGQNTKNWFYNFGDGWGASVTVEKVCYKEKNRRSRISSGFCGYGWMVKEILAYGKILTREERAELAQK